MSKEFFRNDSGVIVTDSTVTDGAGTSYAIRNINSVKTEKYDLPWLGKLIKTAIGGITGTLIFTGIATSSMGELGIITFPLLLGAVGYLCYKIFKGPRVVYQVKLSTSSGDVDQFSSFDPEGPMQISEAINQAISELNQRAA
jgi:hypothetical protein